MEVVKRAIGRRNLDKIQAEKDLEVLSRLNEVLERHPSHPLTGVREISITSTLCGKPMGINFMLHNEDHFEAIKKVLSGKLSTEFEEVSRNGLGGNYKGKWGDIPVYLKYPC